MKGYIACYIPLQIPYFGKICVLRYESKSLEQNDETFLYFDTNSLKLNVDERKMGVATLITGV